MMQYCAQVCDRDEGAQAILQAREHVVALVEKQLNSKRQRDTQIGSLGHEELNRLRLRTVDANMDYLVRYWLQLEILMNGTVHAILAVLI
jgi:hypothetical protein